MLRTPILALAAVAAAACAGGDSTTPTDSGRPEVRIPASISLTPSSLSFEALGDTQRVVAVARDQHGAQLDSFNVAWSSSDTSVATVSPAGLVTSVGHGTATVIATAAAIEATASVIVSLPDVAITTSALEDGTVGVSYRDTLAATGGSGGYSWSLVSGALPPGLSMSSGGEISGQPTAAGTSTFNAQVESGGRTARGDVSITINPLSSPSTRGTVAILVDPALDAPTSAARAQFRTDLLVAGYHAVEALSSFKSPIEVRDYLRTLYADPGYSPLRGVILIGDIPKAYQFVTLETTNPDLSDISEEAISYQFYADLDGTFGTSVGYASPGGHPYSFDLHEGDVDWEIWVGVLPLYEGDYAASSDALNRYFAKNHAYRAGYVTLPRRLVEVTEHFSATTTTEFTTILNNLRSGPYSWTPWSASSDAEFFFNSVSPSLSAADGYDALRNSHGDFFVGDAHGTWDRHGQIDVAWVRENPIGTFFFWSNGCAVGDLDHAGNFLTSMLYSPTSMVVVAKGTTNDSGGMGTNADGFFGHNIATSMSQGSSIGDALVHHVNVPLIWPWSTSREFHVATSILLGDPTLSIRP
jgi:hypothetical protein